VSHSPNIAQLRARNISREMFSARNTIFLFLCLFFFKGGGEVGGIQIKECLIFKHRIFKFCTQHPLHWAIEYRPRTDAALPGVEKAIISNGLKMNKSYEYDFSTTFLWSFLSIEEFAIFSLENKGNPYFHLSILPSDQFTRLLYELGLQTCKHLSKTNISPSF
jgi:hypothetical protein